MTIETALGSDGGNVLNIQLGYQWRPVESTAGVRYMFPEQITRSFPAIWKAPAVYRWVLFRDEPGDQPILYVGETDRLARRIKQYVDPGPTQKTNLRVNAHFTEEMKKGFHVALDVLEFEPFRLGAVTVSQDDLRDKFLRRLLENLLAFHYSQAGITVLNA